MDKTRDESLQLTPVSSLVRSKHAFRASAPMRQSSEVYCNVRHMLNYIDEVESENFRHAKAIEDRFRAIKDELNCHLQGNARIFSAPPKGHQWESLLIQMERDLQLNRMAVNGIGKNLEQLRIQFECVNQSGDVTPNRLKKSLQYRTPLTNPMRQSPVASLTYHQSDTSPVEQARHDPVWSQVTPTESIFKVPTFVPSVRRATKSKTNQSLKRKLDPEDKFDSIIEATKFWRIELDPNSCYDQRFANIIHGLPKGNASESMSEEQCQRELQEAIGWIDESHLVQNKT